MSNLSQASSGGIMGYGRSFDVLLTAIAPTVWGSTYIVTTQLLPQGYPITVAMLRALPAGLLLMMLVRQLPAGHWWWRVVVLGALNIAFFLTMLFIAAYRLPGGVAATIGAIQPLIVIFLTRAVLGTPVRLAAIAAALAGLAGVALLLIAPRSVVLDPIGIVAGLAGAVSLALGTVMSRRWQPPVSTLTFTAWQLTAGGILLIPVALWLEPPLPALGLQNVAGFAYLTLIGAALTYMLWFRGIARLGPSAVASLSFLSPLTAVVLGWGLLGQSLTLLQLFGMAVVVGSVWLSQMVQAGPART
ncbi:EamA family transporter [Labrys sp. (in: a-proteobacteria)]|uniref:EamA family transporter n=2 Tax=unclassified Labrys (in: a-proteobacteria) TaxID=2688601 RepID=UPI0039E65388